MSAIRLHELHREQRVDVPLRQVFAFFERPENLAAITPRELDFRVLTPSPVPMEQGRLIDYTIRVAGIRLRWRSLISIYRPPHCFVDEQLLGPYSFWHHTHRFEPAGSGTRLIDDVRYALPAILPAPLAGLLNRWQVRPRLEHIFDYRRQQIERLFGDRPATSEAGRSEYPQELADGR